MAVTDKLPDYLSRLALGLLTPAGYSKTLTAAVAAGDDEIDVGALNTTGIAANACVWIGAGEEGERATIESITLNTGVPTGVVVLKEPLLKAHASGATVRGMTLYDLGEPLQEGATITPSGAKEEVRVATRKTPFLTYISAPSFAVTTQMPYCTPEMFAVAWGRAVSALTGAGTNASPRHIGTTLSDLGDGGDACVVIEGVLKDGSVVRHEVFATAADFSAFSWTAKRPSQNGISLSWTGTGGYKIAETAIDCTLSTAWKGTNAKSFNYLLEAGLLQLPGSGGLNTTSTALEPKGETVIALTAVTNIAKGTLLRFTDADGLIQHGIAESVASLNVTMKTPLVRALPSSSTVRIVEKVRNTPIADAAPQLGFSGSKSDTPAADYRSPIISEYPDLSASATLPMLGQDAPRILLAAGVNPAVLTGGIALIKENLGTHVELGAYVRFQMYNGDIGWLIYGNCPIPAESVSIVINNQGTANPLNLVLEPADEVRFFVGPDL